jgi:uncharacterized protein YcbK (DUF882 family)
MKSPAHFPQSSPISAGENDSPLSRRTFVKLGAWGAMGALLPGAALGSGKRAGIREKSLALYNTHTGETLKTVYWVEGHYVEDALREINYLLRDRRNDEMHEIDTRLLDLLFLIGKKINTRQPLHIISAYRSTGTNAMLRSRSSGVAENSLHLIGKAIDIRIPGQAISDLRKVAMALKSGGVGYYPKSGFVHVDVGRVRYW